METSPFLAQRFYGEKTLLTLLIFLDATIPLSNDMYLPALPQMTVYFQTSEAAIGLTISLFFVFFAIGALLWGPMSDRYGRKPVLLVGMSVYALSSLACTFSTTLPVLITIRSIQAISCSAATTVSLAIIKDVFVGRKRASYVALLQSMTMLSPVIAPFIGAVLVSHYSWQVIFWGLGCTGIISLFGVFLLTETNTNRNKSNFVDTMSRLQKTLENHSFVSLLITFSFVAMPVLAFIACSPHIYISKFGLSEQVYSYYFAANAIVCIIGPLCYIQLSKQIDSNKILKTGYIFVSIGGMLICTLGNINAPIFATCIAFTTFAAYILYPYTVNLTLEQQKSDTGAATSLIIFVTYVMGGIGMQLIVLDWINQIVVLGGMYVLTGIISLTLFTLICSKIDVKQIACCLIERK